MVGFCCLSDVIVFLPELFFGFTLCFYLLFFSVNSFLSFSFFSKTIVSSRLSFSLAVYICLFSILLITNNSIGFNLVFLGSFTYDWVSLVGKQAVLLLSLFIFTFSFRTPRVFFNFEFFFIILISIFSILILLSSTDLIAVYICLELQSLCFYLLSASFRSSSFSIEAGIKYFIIGAFASGFFLFGSSLIYGFLGTTNYLIIRDLFFIDSNLIDNFIFINVGFFLILVSFLFKLGVAPYHFWLADIYEGSLSFITLFFICLPKFVLFICLLRFLFIQFFSFYHFILLFSAVACFFVGSFGALLQRKVKRFFIFSSFTHVGFLLFSLSTNSIVGVQSIFFYFFSYFFIAVSFFIVVRNLFMGSISHPITFLDELEELWIENRSMALLFIILLFSLAGLPPFSGFFIKLFIFASGLDSSAFIVSVLAICFSLVGCFYYLFIVKHLCYPSTFGNSLFSSSFLFSSLSKSHALLLSGFSFFFVFFVFFSGFFFNLSYLFSLIFFS